MKYVRSVDLDGWAVDCMRTKCETPITPILTVLTECGVTQKSQPQENIAQVPNEANFMSHTGSSRKRPTFVKMVT